VRESYPALLRQAKGRGVRFCLGSDAHRPDAIGRYTWVAALIRSANLADADIVELGPEE
jgi:histidinol phosphatase-like PHP family hydrolase